jgi:hypothetical protein
VRWALAWLGWPHLRIKAQGPWHKGACFDFLPSFGVRSTQKVPGAPARCQASFPIALKLFTKTFLIGSMAGLRINDQKNAITVTVIIVTAFKICISHRKNGLLNRLPTKVSFSIFD